MARTAPAPNMIAAPGMNPGNIVAGGGGGAGGGSGKGSKGGKGGKGNGGDGDDEDAEGGGKAAGDCGTGAPGGCTSCDSAISRGDPVDVATGEMFTLPIREFNLPGTFNLEVQRTYSSRFRDWDVGLGGGWAHSLAWELRITRRSIVIRNGSRTEEKFPLLTEEGEQAYTGGWALLRMADGFVLRPGNEFQHYFVRSEHDPDLYQLSAVGFRARGLIRLSYEREKLKRVTDTVGRHIDVAWNEERIESFSSADNEGRRHYYARYEYDEARRLGAAYDANGDATRYLYDQRSQLVQLQYATGLTFHYEYDKQGRCVETWGDYPSGQDPALDPDVPEFLADGTTRAKGIHHLILNIYDEEFREAVDSVRVQRYTAKPDGTLAKAVDGGGGVTEHKDDHRGRTVERVDSLGGAWYYEYDGLDQIIREEDPEKRVRTIDRDSEGRPIVMVDGEGGRVLLTRRSDGELISATNAKEQTWAFGLDDRGQILERIDPLGARTVYQRDAHSNIELETEPSGRVIRFQHDFLGRRTHQIDSESRESHYQYDAKGQLTAQTDPLGRQTISSYDAMGNELSSTNAGGFTTRYQWGGFKWLAKQVFPNGSELNMRYNREGWLQRVINEAGEEHLQTHSYEGQVENETSFDGRKKSMDYDARSFQSSYEEADQKISFERNAVGQLLSAEATDGSLRSYKYDRRGNRTRFENNGVSVNWGWDKAANLTSESFEIEGRKYTVDSVVDPLGRRLSTQTSLGYELVSPRDHAGRCVGLTVNGRRVTTFERDRLGDITVTQLARGGRIQQRHDAAQRLIETSIEKMAMPTASGQPSMVGGDTPTLRKTFEYDARDELIARSSNGQRTEYKYNERRELLSVQQGEDEERFTVDAAGNYMSNVPGAGSMFERGNRLVQRGQTNYSYDDAGQLLEKRVSTAGGNERIWRYEWDAFKFLRAVETPEGKRVEFLYDTYARRVSKKVIRHEALGDIVESHTHYIWDRVALLQEVDVLGEEPVVLRSYGYVEQGDEVPAGHVDGQQGEWIHYLTDQNGTPEQLLDGAGLVVGELEREAFGRVTKASGLSTAIRFPGQYADEETGLHYNRYRYYDPEAGRYISPDPINLAGGVNLYAYGPNPIGWFDPMGWEHVMKVSVVEGSDALKAVLDGKKLASGMGEDCADHLKSQARCHTERKFGDVIRANKDKIGKNTKFKLEGELPPCPNCHRAMQKLADDCGGEYTYEYGEKGNKQSVTYRGGKSSKFTDKELKGAYKMSPIDKKAPISKYLKPGMSPDEKQHIQDSLDLGYKFDNWNAARSGYTAAKP